MGQVSNAGLSRTAATPDATRQGETGFAPDCCPPEEARGKDGKVIQRERNHFQNHSARIRYQETAKRGWPIGSGTVESTCRQQKQCHFKRCGQFWTAKGLRNLCALDEARRNHHWDDLRTPI
jgi:hypothetical protein